MVPELLGDILNAAVDRIDLDPGLVVDVICGKMEYLKRGKGLTAWLENKTRERHDC